MKEYIALAIFAIVYVLIVGRIRFKVPIWIAMSIGAVLMILFQITDVESAAKSVQVDVIVFLFAMFSIVSALDRSGLLKLVAAKMMSKAKTPDLLLMAIVVGMGLLSAFLVNDTIALMGIPLIIYISKHVGARPVVLLIALQSGIPLPFTSFLEFLAVPTVVNLFLTWYLLKIYFKKDLLQMSHNYKDNILMPSMKIENPRL